METFWNPLTLSEAQGYVTAYVVTYRESINNNWVVEMSAANSNRTTISGLKKEASYYVQVWATTVAGPGERSQVILVEPPPSNPASIGVVAGGAAGVLVLIVAVIIVIIIVVVVVKHCLKQKKKKKQPNQEE